MEDIFLPTDLHLGVVSRIENPKLQELKNYFKKQYGSHLFHPPHLTFLLSPIKPDISKQDLFVLEAELRALLSSIKPFEIQIRDVEVDELNRFVKLRLDRELILDLHYSLLSLIQKYRANSVREKDFIKYSNNKYSAEEINLLKKYGYTRSGSNFDLHITIGDIADDAEVDFLQLRAWLNTELKEFSKQSLSINEFHSDLFKENGTAVADKIWSAAYRYQNT